MAAAPCRELLLGVGVFPQHKPPPARAWSGFSPLLPFAARAVTHRRVCGDVTPTSACCAMLLEESAVNQIRLWFLALPLAGVPKSPPSQPPSLIGP